MDSSLFLGITTFGYLAATIFYAAILIFKTERFGKVATFVAFASLICQTIGLGLRWLESYQLGIGHAPLTNMYESVVFFSWSIVLIYLIIEKKYQTKIIGAFAIPFAFLAMAYGSLASEINRGISPLVPALQSNWLIVHVVTCFIGYAAFAISAAIGIMIISKNKEPKRKPDIDSHPLNILPKVKILEDVGHKTMVFGFLWLTVGIITGAIWANSAWGTYWSWDPKETWSLITWFIYAITLHVKFTRGWSGTRIAWLAIIGFASVIFTYYGVNFLLSGLHSYGSA